MFSVLVFFRHRRIRLWRKCSSVLMSFMNILDRFSEHLRETLARAMQTAIELKNPEVEPLHLVFALSRERGSVASEILGRLKLDPKLLEQSLLSLPAMAGKESAAEGKKKVAQELFPPLSVLSRTALERAIMLAQKNQHSHLGTEHLLAGLLALNDKRVEEVFKLSKIKVEDLNRQIDAVLKNASQFPRLDEAAELAERLRGNLSEMPLGQMPIMLGRKGKEESALSAFAIELTAADNQKNLDPVIGREAEIERLIQILCRRTKNNPVLLGDPGVGKTAIVEGLAKKIAAGEVPSLLREKKIFALDMGLLIAGTIYRGEFEARLKEIIDEAAEDPETVLFIDEIHNIVGAGSNQGTMDAANLLKPALSRGLLRCIGSTTPAEFKKYIESDAALERRFQPIFVREPSEEETIKILAGLKPNYEKYHSVKISDEALNAAVELSVRHISGKFLPDKAIDLLDETAAAKRLAGQSAAMDVLTQKRLALRKMRQEKETAALDERFGEALQIKDNSDRLAGEIKEMEKKSSQQEKEAPIISAADVLNQVAKITNATPSELTMGEKEKYAHLEQELKKRVIGQDEVVADVSRLVRQAQLGLSAPERPLAGMLFVGESGVGKTELAKTLAKALYPNQDALVKLDMSEFTEAYGISKLLGSPAGYIGYRDANQFGDRLKMNPYSVVLFDEIDKAHAEVLKILLQILEEGEVTDATGKKISLKHAIIILTTSFGSDELKRGDLGFSRDEEKAAENRKRLIEKLKERFTTELINRLDQICLFRSLEPADLAKIAELEIVELNSRLKKYRTAVSAEPDTLNWLITGLPEKKSNARDVRRMIRTMVEGQLGEIILKGQVKPLYRLAAKNQTLALK